MYLPKIHTSNLVYKHISWGLKKKIFSFSLPPPYPICYIYVAIGYRGGFPKIYIYLYICFCTRFATSMQQFTPPKKINILNIKYLYFYPPETLKTRAWSRRGVGVGGGGSQIYLYTPAHPSKIALRIYLPSPQKRYIYVIAPYLLHLCSYSPPQREYYIFSIYIYRGYIHIQRPSAPYLLHRCSNWVQGGGSPNKLYFSKKYQYYINYSNYVCVN